MMMGVLAQRNGGRRDVAEHIAQRDAVRQRQRARPLLVPLPAARLAKGRPRPSRPRLEPEVELARLWQEVAELRAMLLEIGDAAEQAIREE